MFAVLAAVLASSGHAGLPGGTKKVQVFLLAGQSNMEGHGQVRSLARLGEWPGHAELLDSLRSADGSWTVRDDVTIVWAAKDRPCGPLTVGWGVGANEVGPELAFGVVMGDAIDAPVLLIKTAWGGKDVYCDFRSPSAGTPTGEAAARLEKERADGRGREVGLYYRRMVADVRDALQRLDELVTGYEGQGYELAGMAWFQGWNDYCVWRDAPEILEQYPGNLAAMIRDLRAELGAPDLPVVIGELGIGGPEIERRAANPDDREARALSAFRRAQRAVLDEPTLTNVAFVPTAAFWDERLDELRRMRDTWSSEKRRQGIADTEENQLPTKELTEEYESRGGHWYCHYNGSAATYSLIGEALARALLLQASAQTAPR